MKKKHLAFLLTLFTLMGCANVQKATQLKTISLGVSQAEVVENIGQPTVVRGAIQNAHNETVEVWEYHMQLPLGENTGKYIIGGILTCGIGFLADLHPYRDYWLYFVNGSFVKWGEAGDWQTEKDKIYNLRFNAKN